MLEKLERELDEITLQIKASTSLAPNEIGALYRKKHKLENAIDIIMKREFLSQPVASLISMRFYNADWTFGKQILHNTEGEYGVYLADCQGNDLQTVSHGSKIDCVDVCTKRYLPYNPILLNVSIWEN